MYMIDAPYKKKKKNPKKTSCTAIYFPSHKPYKKDQQDILVTTNEIRANW